MNKNSKILITGGSGMVGSAVINKMQENEYKNILSPKSKELNLISQDDVFKYFESHKPEFVFHIAGKVGGIYANMTYKADFLYENLMMAANIIHACKKYNIKKVLFVSSGCIYPDSAKNPILESSLLTGSLQESHEHYAIAKIAGIKLCEAYNFQYGLNYVTIVPNNIYGPNDNYHPQNSHVMAALIAKFHYAKTNNINNVEIWGSGNQKREFIYVDDIATASILLMEKHDINGIYNCAGGENITIRILSEKIAKIINYEGKIDFNTNKPEGHLEKYFNCDKLISIGWKPKINLDEGIKLAYNWYKNNLKEKLRE